MFSLILAIITIVLVAALALPQHWQYAASAAVERRARPQRYSGTAYRFAHLV